MSSGLEYDTDPMLGEPVDTHPAKEPFRTTLKSRLVTVMSVDPTLHSRDLFDTLCGPGKNGFEYTAVMDRSMTSNHLIIG